MAEWIKYHSRAGSAAGGGGIQPASSTAASSIVIDGVTGGGGSKVHTPNLSKQCTPQRTPRGSFSGQAGVGVGAGRTGAATSPLQTRRVQGSPNLLPIPSPNPMPLFRLPASHSPQTSPNQESLMTPVTPITPFTLESHARASSTQMTTTQLASAKGSSLTIALSQSSWPKAAPTPDVGAPSVEQSVVVIHMPKEIESIASPIDTIASPSVAAKNRSSIRPSQLRLLMHESFRPPYACQRLFHTLISEEILF